ncbi:hypothetical protein BGW37DRAFT_259754 [Umbelopsis sp. PMI_123]|nr:hypothetical protein BGW37DRAFT_259754 [Umbelopsis sp. PMI_123]
MFKIRSRKHSQPLPSTTPLVVPQKDLLDFSFLTTPANIVESFSDELLSQFEPKYKTTVTEPIVRQQEVQEQVVEDSPPPSYQAPAEVNKLPSKPTELNTLVLDEAFQRFLNGGDTPNFSVASRKSSVVSGNGMNETVTEEQATTLNEKDAESNNLLRKSSSYFRSKFKKFKTVRSTDNLKKLRVGEEIIPDLPSPPAEIMRAQDAVTPPLSTIPTENKTLQETHQLTTVPSRLPSTVAENTTISIPPHGSSNNSSILSHTNANISQAPTIANYPPKPLKYSPVKAAEQKDEVTTMDFQRVKRQTSSKRMSLPAVMTRHRSVSQAVTIDNSALDMAEVSKAERRKSDPNMLPTSGTFGRRARIIQSYMSGGIDKTFHRRSFAWSDLPDL